jgi:fucose 4-O-acetylase-like acetyltransferase
MAPIAFHVPVFLIVAGWLGASAVPLAIRSIARRLVRVWLPYTIATVIMTALHFATWRSLPWNLLTGDAVGIYYFIPVWTFCVASGWLWSRMSEHALGIALGLVIVVSIFSFAMPLGLSYFWEVRDPFVQGWLGYYLFGWCARRFDWHRAAASRPGWATIAIPFCLPWLLTDGFFASTPFNDAARTAGRFAYSMGFAWMVCAWQRNRPPRPVEYLASVTLPVFLYHLPIAFAVDRQIGTLDPSTRIVATFVLTLLFTLGGIALAQTVLAKRIQVLLLGA